MQREHDEYAGIWSRRGTVPVITLDTLIEHYGPPAYIKIDVEGFEEFVLDGLSNQPPLLSFEFNAACRDATIRCLEKRVFSPESVLNFTLGDPIRFELSTWASKDELESIITKLRKCDIHGDIFVRRPASERLPEA
jgi:hypothetical protein